MSTNHTDSEPQASGSPQKTSALQKAMIGHDAKIEEAVAALRVAAKAASINVHALLIRTPAHVRLRIAGLNQTMRPWTRPRAFTGLAHDLQEIALRMRLIESTIQGALEHWDGLKD